MRIYRALQQPMLHCHVGQGLSMHTNVVNKRQMAESSIVEWFEMN